jgi:hypothetical protein
MARSPEKIKEIVIVGLFLVTMLAALIILVKGIVFVTDTINEVKKDFKINNTAKEYILDNCVNNSCTVTIDGVDFILTKED